MPTPLNRKPPIAAWIVRERKRLGLKPRDLVERLRAQGLTISEATVKVWESNADRRPAPENLDGLERIFQSRAPRDPEPFDLAIAVREQTAAIQAQVDAIRDQTVVLQQVLERLTDPEVRQRELESVTDVQEFRVLEKLEQVARLLRDPEPRPRTPKGRQ